MTRRVDATKPARALLAIVALACAIVVLIPRTALAAPSAYWRLSSSSAPANLAPGQEGTIIVTANNAGDANNTPSAGHPIKITDILPEGVTATATPVSKAPGQIGLLPCTVEPVTCTDENATLLPSIGLQVRIKVKVASTIPSGTVLTNEVRAEGAEAPTETVREPVRIDEHPASFGVEKYEFRPEEEGGATDTQAGSHPFQLTTALSFNLDASEEPVALPKNLQFTLPPGMIGNPLAIPRCSQVDFNTIVPQGGANLCPGDTAVGIAEVFVKEPREFPRPTAFTLPVFNVEPAAGEPARLGFTVLKASVPLETSVRTGSDYAVVVTAKDTSQSVGIASSRVEIWGVPGDARHNAERGWECANGGVSNPPFFPKCSEQKPPEAPFLTEAPFLSMPTSCDAPLHAPMQAQSWVPGTEYTPPMESSFQEQLTGCSALEFAPTFATTPDEHSASTPTGLGVEVGMPKNAPQFETPTGLAQSALRATTVTLPEGVQLNPAAAGGLGACSAFEVGFEPGFPESAQTENNHFSPGPFGCNDAAKVGTVSIKSPDLENELKGYVYLGREHTNPFEAPLVIYILAEDCGGTVPATPQCAAPNSGVRVKLSGTVTPNQSTGQLVSTFENNPQVPFESFNLHFFNGPRASLATPTGCGTYTATTSFTPWSGAAAAAPSSSFDITSGVGGGGCPGNPLPFAPSLNAGSNNTQAGAFTPFTLTIDKPDGQQPLSGLTMTLPPGLAAMISSVTPCPQAQVATNSCGPESLIGHSLASAGLGGEPFTLPGTVYFTQGYNGAPFGLSVVTPAVAGPFNLGDVTVRSTINVDRNTAAVTINSEPFPTMLKGVPTQLKQIKVVVDRPNFQFNPTNCNPMSIASKLTGAQGGVASATHPFKAQNCAALSFHPTLVAEADGRASKPNGTTFRVRVTSGAGQSNIGKTELTLPIQLPSRLTTIQKACLAATFEANPASCPEGSNIGNALAVTPVLKNPLRGPAYLVSHGNAAFPDVEFVLQGEGLTLVLDGKTDIKKGITYSRFESVPDAPVSLFETTLPAGPHSALTANVPESEHFNLCRQKLTVPTVLTGQNGLVVSQNTKVKLLNCPKIKPLTRAQLLAKAKASCNKRFKHNRAKRNKCIRQAQRKYGAHKASTKHKKKHK
jgi:hypothetical protein